MRRGEVKKALKCPICEVWRSYRPLWERIAALHVCFEGADIVCKLIEALARMFKSFDIFLAKSSFCHDDSKSFTRPCSVNFSLQLERGWELRMTERQRMNDPGKNRSLVFAWALVGKLQPH